MGTKLDCQKLRHCLSECFFVDSSLSTFDVSQNLLKIGHPEIRNTCYGYQYLRTRCNLQGETPSKVSLTLMHHLWTFQVDLRWNLDDLQLLELISSHNIRETKTTNLYNYLRFCCGNIMWTVGPNINLLPTKVTSTNTNGYGVQNDTTFALCWATGGFVGPHSTWGQNQELEVL